MQELDEYDAKMEKEKAEIIDQDLNEEEVQYNSDDDLKEYIESNSIKDELLNEAFITDKDSVKYETRNKSKIDALNSQNENSLGLAGENSNYFIDNHGIFSSKLRYN